MNSNSTSEIYNGPKQYHTTLGVDYYTLNVSHNYSVPKGISYWAIREVLWEPEKPRDRSNGYGITYDVAYGFQVIPKTSIQSVCLVACYCEISPFEKHNDNVYRLPAKTFADIENGLWQSSAPFTTFTIEINATESCEVEISYTLIRFSDSNIHHKSRSIPCIDMKGKENMLMYNDGKATLKYMR